MALFLVGAWLCNKIHPTPKHDEIILGGMPISRTPCLSVVNELFGKGVDSNKACDCLLPAYYQLVKDDPEELTKFDYTGIHMLPGTRNDQVNQLFTECIGNHIVDSTYIMHLPEAYASRFRQQLADRLRSDPTYKSYNPDSLASCVISRLNDRFTVSDYIGLSQWTTAKAKALLQPCLTRHQ
jgi:hypothetical protein